MSLTDAKATVRAAQKRIRRSERKDASAYARANVLGLSAKAAALEKSAAKPAGVAPASREATRRKSGAR